MLILEEKNRFGMRGGSVEALCLLLVLTVTAHCQSLSISTLAGSGSFGSQDAAALSAQFSDPSGVAVDPAGNVYVADTYNCVIRRISAGAGGANRTTTTLAGLAPSAGNRDGTNAAARFNSPTALALDASGNIYVADSGNHSIRRVSADATGTNWIVKTLAGSGRPGAVNATNTAAQFDYPTGVAVDGAGNVYVADQYNSAIRIISPDATGTNWVANTYAGQLGASGNRDGAAGIARFSAPNSVALDSATNLYVADGENYTVRMITPAGMVSTLAGTGTYGSADGSGTNIGFNFPCGLAVDGATNIYVSDFFNGTIRQLTCAGASWSSVTLAGHAGFPGANNGVGPFARFDFAYSSLNPNGVAVDAAGNVYISDSDNYQIRLGVPYQGLLLNGTPIAVTGFNSSFVVENTAVAIGGMCDTSLYAQPFQTVNVAFAFYETNLNATHYTGGSPHNLGLPQNGRLTSLLDGSTVFQLAPYTGNSALGLSAAAPSGTLYLVTPGAYESLSILAASANGGGTGTFVIKFANGNASAPLSYVANDWYDDPGAAALTHFGRIYCGNYDRFYADNATNNDPNLYQTTVDLAALNLGSEPISAVEFFLPSGGKTTTAIFALSGTPALSLNGPALAPGNLSFSFQTVSNKTYTVEQCTDLAPGRWQVRARLTGNGQALAFAAPLTNSQQYFRLRQP